MLLRRRVIEFLRPVSLIGMALLLIVFFLATLSRAKPLDPNFLSLVLNLTDFFLWFNFILNLVMIIYAFFLWVADLKLPWKALVQSIVQALLTLVLGCVFFFFEQIINGIKLPL